MNDYVYGTHGKTHVESKAVGDENDWHSVDVITYQNDHEPLKNQQNDSDESSNDEFLNIENNYKRHITIQNNFSSYLRYSSVAPATNMRSFSAEINHTPSCDFTNISQQSSGISLIDQPPPRRPASAAPQRRVREQRTYKDSQY